MSDKRLTSGYMTEAPVTIAPDRPLIDALALLGTKGFRHLPVVQDGRLVGIVSDRDIHRTLSERGAYRSADADGLFERTIASMMTRDVATATPLTTLAEAARVFLDRKVSALPVLDEGRLVGILTTDDILRAFLEMQPK